MRRILQTTLLTSSIVAGGLACATLPVCAQMDQMGDADSYISFDSFHDQLAPYGYWLYSDRWGVVWQPSDVPYDFRPYDSSGHWVYTDDYGWYWLSNYSWGDIPFHYGRWVNDPDDGWLWLPGYIWSPGWVAWRSNGSVIGWTPLPPDNAYLEGRGDIGVGLSVRFGDFDVGALYSRWYGPEFNERMFAQNWVFVPAGFMAAPDYQRVIIRDPARIINIINHTRNVTNYTVINNVVVNRSVDVHLVERAAGHPIAVVRAATVIKHPNLVVSVAVGQRVQMRMRDVVPRGRGLANSAPPPPQRVVARLSTNVTPRNGRTPVHLFTRTTVTAPQAQSRFHGAPVPGAPRGEAGGAMTGPNAQGMRPEQPGATGSGGMRSERPNGSGPNGEGMRPGQPGGPSRGGMGPQQPNGTGPNGEGMRPDQPSGPGRGGTGPQQPNGTGPNGAGMAPEQQGGSGPGGMRPEQPNGAGPNGAGMAPEQQGGSGPGGMRPEHPNGTGPSGESMRPGQSGGGPAGQGQNEHMQPGQAGGMAGPGGGNMRSQQPGGSPGANPKANPQNGTPERKQKKKDEQKPPQNPPQ